MSTGLGHTGTVNPIHRLLPARVKGLGFSREGLRVSRGLGLGLGIHPKAPRNLLDRARYHLLRPRVLNLFSV